MQKKGLNMSNFTDKAFRKLDKLSDEQILRLIKNQTEQLNLRDKLLNAMDSGFLVLDSSKKIVYFNDYLTKLLSFDGSKVNKGRTNINKIITSPQVLAYINNCFTNTDNKMFIDFDQHSSLLGDIKLRLSQYQLTDSNLLFLHFLDITFFEKLKIEYKKNESLAQMTTVAAGVAHEIKNPLASISIYLQLLQKKLEKNGSITLAEASKSLSVINTEIDRLNTIAVDFLFAVKPMNVNLQLKSLNDCVKNTMTLAKPELENEKIKTQIFLGNSLPKVLIDEKLVEQCILNLVKNAMQAISPDNKTRSITLNTYQDGNILKLSVADTGCGMNAQQISKIFEPYYTTKATGTGLGLTTIFKIMKEHNGEINVTSTEEKGSVFTLSFPIPPTERFRISNNHESLFSSSSSN